MGATTLVTSRNEQSTSLLADHDVIFVPRVPPRGLWQAARALAYAWPILRSGRYTDLISTGAGLAVPFMVVGRLLGVRCQFIESAARTDGPSLTGRMLERIPGVRLATQYRSWADQRWQYAGSVFDGFAPVPDEASPGVPPRKVVVTLGSHQGVPFTRAVEAAERLTRELGVAPGDVFWQVGDLAAGHEGRQGWVSADQLDREIRSADLIISHAGVGTCLQVLEAGKVPVLLPRRVSFGEAVDDHQRLIAEALAARGLAVVVEPEELSAAHAFEAMALRTRQAEVVGVPPLMEVLDLHAGSARPLESQDQPQPTARHADEVTVSVIIPTHRRPDEVVRAVRSALSQTRPPLEVVVVVDGPHAATLEALGEVVDPRLRIVEHAESRGAGAARNTGVRVASGDFVAFLDDDDTWYPQKLERQVRTHLASPATLRTVSATGVRIDRGDSSVVWPLREPDAGEAIPDYLFVRRRAGEGVLLTSSLMVPTDLARQTPFPEDLKNHEEWDWLVTLSAGGVRAVVDKEPLVHYDARPIRSSVSASNQDWRSSLEWARGRRRDLGARAFSALVLTEVGRAAAYAGAGTATQLSILRASLDGRPRAWDVGRHLLRPVIFRIQGRRLLGR